MINKKYFTQSAAETKKLGRDFAQKIIRENLRSVSRKSAIVIGLKGELGSGKTTFLQGFAKELGIKDKITSPTFVIYKKFKIQKPDGKLKSKPKIQVFENFYHFDCYRLKKPEEILELMGLSAKGGPVSGWKEIISDPRNIVAIEWSERIKKILPQTTIFIRFKFVEKNKREVLIC